MSVEAFSQKPDNAEVYSVARKEYSRWLAEALAAQKANDVQAAQRLLDERDQIEAQFDQVAANMAVTPDTLNHLIQLQVSFTRLSKTRALELELILAQYVSQFLSNLQPPNQPAIPNQPPISNAAPQPPIQPAPVNAAPQPPVQPPNRNAAPLPNVPPNPNVAPPPPVQPHNPNVVLTPEQIAELEALKKRAADRIQDAWAQLLRLETPTNKEPATDLVTKPYDSRAQNIHEAGILPLVKEFFGPELPEWELRRDIFDAFTKGCEGEGSKNQEPIVQLGWKNALGAREKVTSQISIDRLRGFSNNPRFKGLVETATRLFDGDNIYYVVATAGTPTGDPAKDWILCERTTPGAIQRVANFGKDGNRGASNTTPADEGGKNFEELLAYQFVKDLQQKAATGSVLSPQEEVIVREGVKAFEAGYCHSDLDVVQFFVVIGELRLRQYTKYYEGYAKTADSTFDIKTLVHHSPLAEIGYRIRGYGYIPTKLAMLWQILRYPKAGGRFVRKVNVPADLDIDQKRKMYKRDATGHILSRSDWDGEYLPTPLDPTKLSDTQVDEAVQVRNLIDLGLTKFADVFEPVHVPDDLTIFPHLWDIIYAKDKNFKDITFSLYNEAFGAWVDFLEIMSHPPSPDATEITDSFTAMASALARLKGMIVVMEGTEHGEAFVKLLQQVVLRYLKVVYDQYDLRSQTMSVGAKLKTGSMTPKGYFFKQLREATTVQKTLHKSISSFIFDLCDKYEGWNFRYNLFSPIRDDKTSATISITVPGLGNVPFPGKWTRYASLAERYIPTPKREEETKKAH